MGLDEIHTLSAACNCGYESEDMPFGTHPSIKENKFYTPSLCKTCGELYCTNLKSNPPLCCKCFSSDIDIYGSASLTGELVEIDINSDDFKEYYAIADQFYELDCEDEQIPYTSLNIKSCQQEYIQYRQKHREEAPSPILTHYNYCPKCKEYKLKFTALRTGWFVDDLP
jgi:hypothetical protein